MGGQWKEVADDGTYACWEECSAEFHAPCWDFSRQDVAYCRVDAESFCYDTLEVTEILFVEWGRRLFPLVSLRRFRRGVSAKYGDCGRGNRDRLRW